MMMKLLKLVDLDRLYFYAEGVQCITLMMRSLMPIVGSDRLSHPYTQVSPGLFSLGPKGNAGSEAGECLGCLGSAWIPGFDRGRVCVVARLRNHESRHSSNQASQMIAIGSATLLSCLLTFGSHRTDWACYLAGVNVWDWILRTTSAAVAQLGHTSTSAIGTIGRSEPLYSYLNDS
ncbi:2-oxoglutarate dehydrogenase E1 component [Puccinia graminis f. sp. tritici]|uniref:2-oxoglutarate dehydrogenase E1 component n=1 Tax=Puccinia graminis f. sp. tritici TaxID=56615 RepID=A0A5B0R7U2_PUCGR|nr:2-oxoglutarate dehydrogenase E1 component [Puccinia graminis f. sp. tritici]